INPVVPNIQSAHPQVVDIGEDPFSLWSFSVLIISVEFQHKHHYAVGVVRVTVNQTAEKCQTITHENVKRRYFHTLPYNPPQRPFLSRHGEADPPEKRVFWGIALREYEADGEEAGAQACPVV
ncbi:POC1 centriolar protein homolog B isoform X1, partial [Tachysurus ichikawai]